MEVRWKIERGGEVKEKPAASAARLDAPARTSHRADEGQGLGMKNEARDREKRQRSEKNHSLISIYLVRWRTGESWVIEIKSVGEREDIGLI